MGKDKRKLTTNERLSQMIKATAPRFHAPTQSHRPTKPRLVEKALRKAEREER